MTRKKEEAKRKTVCTCVDNIWSCDVHNWPRAKHPMHLLAPNSGGLGYCSFPSSRDRMMEQPSNFDRLCESEPREVCPSCAIRRRNEVMLQKERDERDMREALTRKYHLYEPGNASTAVCGAQFVDGVSSVKFYLAQIATAVPSERVCAACAKAARKQMKERAAALPPKVEQATEQAQFDPVSKPQHYNTGKVECIDALEAATVGLEGIEAVCTANVIKYLWRWKKKNGVEDLRKAKWYLERLIKQVGGES